MNKACVILGAGASHGVAGYAAGVNLAAWQPPLAKQLFDFKDKPQYREVIGQYPGADFLAQNIASKINQTGFDLETELRRLAEHDDEITRQQFKQIPPYIRDVIQRTTVDYVARPSPLYLCRLYLCLRIGRSGPSCSDRSPFYRPGDRSE